ncbi:MAG TPA: hypothetical protein VFR74_00515 [Jiangellales bacterium]|nr:hypothetical protein [Jiangellales bacterium]
MRTSLIRLSLAAAAAILSLAALTLAANAAGPVPTPLAAMCQADGGIAFVDRFGSWRCQGAAVDGMGVFGAERQLCERAEGRVFHEAVAPEGSHGAWLCAPAA